MKPIKAGIHLACAMALGGCGESLYLTSPDPEKPNGNYSLVVPYVTRVSNRIEVAITPVVQSTKPTDPVYPATIAIAVVPVPVSRSFLYVKSNALFSTTANVTVGTDGMLTSSDSSSQQQLTNILTTLGQTAGAILNAGLQGAKLGFVRETTNDRQTCFTALNDALKVGPVYGSSTGYDGASVTTNLVLLTVPASQVSFELTLDRPSGIIFNQKEVGRTDTPGILAFYPIATIAKLQCSVAGRAPVPLSQEVVIYPYLDSHFIDVQRDGLTSPTDTLTFTSGYLVGHKFTNQSAIKTVVDTVTAPVRAVLPSVTSTQSVQIQSTPGKPDTTTTNNQTVTGPPKAPGS